MDRYFESAFQGKIKLAVSRFLNSLSQELIDLDAHLEELSEQIEPYIDEIVQEYGLKCVRFSLAGLDVDNRKYDEIDQSQIASISRVKLAQGIKGLWMSLAKTGDASSLLIFWELWYAILEPAVSALQVQVLVWELQLEVSLEIWPTRWFLQCINNRHHQASLVLTSWIQQT